MPAGERLFGPVEFPRTRLPFWDTAVSYDTFGLELAKASCPLQRHRTLCCDVTEAKCTLCQEACLLRDTKRVTRHLKFRLSVSRGLYTLDRDVHPPTLSLSQPSPYISFYFTMISSTAGGSTFKTFFLGLKKGLKIAQTIEHACSVKTGSGSSKPQRADRIWMFQVLSGGTDPYHSDPSVPYPFSRY